MNSLILNYNFESFLIYIWNNHKCLKDFEKEKTIIYSFSLIGFYPFIEYLISNGFDFNAIINTNYTPLHNACILGSLPLVKLLISYGNKMETPNELPPIYYAYINGNIHIIDYFFEIGWDKEYLFNMYSENQTFLHIACDKLDLEFVKFLINKGCNKESKDQNGNTPLHFACQTNGLPIVEYLISMGCNKDARNYYNETPLHYACESGDLSIVEYLISIGCNKEALTQFNETPLHRACYYPYTSTIKFLISHGCNKEAKNIEGNTPLQIACLNRNLSVVDYLISMGCDINATNKKLQTPLSIANIENYKNI